MCDEIRDTLSGAVDGLMYPSERDAPFDVVQWPASEAETQRELVKKFAGRRRTQRVKEDHFFASLSKTDDAVRFAQLGRIFAEQLTDRAIYRIGQGEASVDLYLIGRSRRGDWIGWHTVSIET